MTGRVICVMDYEHVKGRDIDDGIVFMLGTAELFSAKSEPRLVHKRNSMFWERF
jgi:hypothetical protein